jgi:hypothetical protein
MANKTKSPLAASNLRLPGESLHDQLIDEVFDNALLPLLIAFLMVVFAGIEWFRHLTGQPPSPKVMTFIALATCAWAGIKFFKARKQIENLRLGRRGERWVAQFLEGLRARDFHVYHDVPTGDANIDHVLIGPQGIFTIETKTLSKPEKGQCVIKVAPDGIDANGRRLDRNPIVQAKAQAGWLKNYFGEAGFKPSIQPVVVFPGWFVDQQFDRAAVGAWVLEPKMLDAELAKLPQKHDRDQVRAMALALANYIRTQSELNG